MTKPDDSQFLQRPAPLVLAGAGHAHLVAMRHWLDNGWRPPAGTILASPEPMAWYSGMMPGLIAGRFALAECGIALQPLSERLGITLVQAAVVAVNSHNRTVLLDNGVQLQYRCLSINTGSRPLAPEHTDSSVLQVPAKPFPRFISQWQQWQQSPPVSLLVLGGGAAAFELAMAINRQFRQTAISVICAGSLLGRMNEGIQDRARQYLANAGVTLIEQCHVDTIRDGAVWCLGKLIMSPDAVVLATGAGAQPWYHEAGLDCDAAGFIRVDDRLCARQDGSVLVSGDAASAEGSQRSGVFSVRHGPVLAQNIRAVLESATLIRYRPQRNALALLATADGGALCSYGAVAIGGRYTSPLLGRWKDRLDLSFMRRHRA